MPAWYHPCPVGFWYVLKRAHLRYIPKPGLGWSDRLINIGIELILIHDSRFIILAYGKILERMRLLIINEPLYKQSAPISHRGSSDGRARA